MRSLAVPIGLLVSASSCTIPLVSTDHAHVEWVRAGAHGHYEKLGVRPTGLTCGEQFHRMVAGVPEATAEMDRCETSTHAYGYLMSGFVVLPALGFGARALDPGDGGPILSVAAGLAITSFAVGFYMAYRASGQLHDAVRAYNAALP